MKTVLTIYFAFSLIVLWLLFGASDKFLGVGEQASTPTLAATPTLNPSDFIYAILEDNNALLYCRVVRQPIDPIFQTATALAQVTLTVTKTPQATWTAVPSSTTIPLGTSTMPAGTPSQELTPVASPQSTTPPLTLTALVALNVRSCPAGVNPSTACAFVRVAAAGSTVQATGITFDGGSILWRKLASGEWIAEIINGGRVLTP